MPHAEVGLTPVEQTPIAGVEHLCVKAIQIRLSPIPWLPQRRRFQCERQLIDAPARQQVQ